MQLQALIGSILALKIEPITHKEYENNAIALKRRFFDRLNKNDKAIIYSIINQLM